MQHPGVLFASYILYIAYVLLLLYYRLYTICYILLPIYYILYIAAAPRSAVCFPHKHPVSQPSSHSNAILHAYEQYHTSVTWFQSASHLAVMPQLLWCCRCTSLHQICYASVTFPFFSFFLFFSFLFFLLATSFPEHIPDMMPMPL